MSILKGLAESQLTSEKMTSILSLHFSQFITEAQLNSLASSIQSSIIIDHSMMRMLTQFIINVRGLIRSKEQSQDIPSSLQQPPVASTSIPSSSSRPLIPSVPSAPSQILADENLSLKA